jgi:hypothetical protein
MFFFWVAGGFRFAMALALGAVSLAGKKRREKPVYYKPIKSHRFKKKIKKGGSLPAGRCHPTTHNHAPSPARPYLRAGAEEQQAQQPPGA